MNRTIEYSVMQHFGIINRVHAEASVDFVLSLANAEKNYCHTQKDAAGDNQYSEGVQSGPAKGKTAQRIADEYNVGYAESKANARNV